MKLTLESWPAYASLIAGKAEPDEYSPAAMERLMRDIDPYVVEVKGIRKQFKERNGISIIEFETFEDRRYYKEAYERYQQEKAKIEAKMDSGGGGSKLDILVQLIKFQQAAEIVKAHSLARAMYEAATLHGKAPVAALKYKASVAKTVRFLVEEFGVPRDQISLIWGGGNTSVSKKRKEKIDVKSKLTSNAALMELLGEGGIDLYDLGLGSAEKAIEVDTDPALRLGAQTPEERQKEIDKFQKGKSTYCLFTFKSGGVGLSLHHSDELTKEKCRRKESGYVVEEDIPNIPVRPRECFLAVTYSAIELVQGLGRCPRITSLSDTPQTILFYRGTIEERIAYIVSVKLKCLRKVVRNKESWEDVILGGVSEEDRKDEVAKGIALLENGRAVVEDEDGDIIELENEDED